MNEYYYPYHEAQKGIEQSMFGHIYSSAKACPPALIQSLARETISSFHNDRFAKLSQIVRLLI